MQDSFPLGDTCQPLGTLLTLTTGEGGSWPGVGGGPGCPPPKTMISPLVSQAQAASTHPQRSRPKQATLHWRGGAWRGWRLGSTVTDGLERKASDGRVALRSPDDERAHQGGHTPPTKSETRSHLPWTPPLPPGTTSLTTWTTPTPPVPWTTEGVSFLAGPLATTTCPRPFSSKGPPHHTNLTSPPPGLPQKPLLFSGQRPNPSPRAVPSRPLPPHP